ncbi:MAG: domain S-box protein [Chitinophagaceae bacterium]|nr:domain S-box protein [Chitinophagaceae bacterium]
MNFDSNFFQAVLQNVADGIVACDENGILIFFNSALEQIHDKPLKPLRPDEWAQHYNLYYPDGSGLMKTEDVPLYRAWKGEKVENIEMLIIPGEGERKFVYASGGQIKNAEGKVMGAVVNMHDISEINEANKRLNEIRHFTEKISDVTPGLITVFNGVTGKYRYVNKAASTIFGYTARDILTGGFEFVVSLIHPEDVSKILEENQKAIAVANEKYPDYNDNDAVEFEYRMKHKNGEYIWVHTYGVVFGRDKNNSVEEILNITVDITERKNAELRALQSKISEDYFRDLADQSPFMVWKVDDKGLCTYVNKPWSDFTGLSFEESLNLGWGKAFHPDDAEAEYEKFMSCFNQSKPYHSKFRLKTKDGEYRWVLAQSNPLQQKEKGYIGSLTDITEQEAAQEATKLLMQRKDEFISMASHELKTPVTSLKAFTQILQMTFEQEGHTVASDMLIKMDKQINKLTRLITDLLDASKANAGQMEMQYDKDRFDFNELLKEISDEMQRTSQTHTIELNLTDTKTVVGDKNRIGQVITNLISNAIKYSPDADCIVITTSHDNDKIKCCVQDFGIGIPEQEQPKLFTRFFRVTNDNVNTYPGLGLGLYITNEIVKRHSGSIDFKSKEGKGSTFCFSLPLKSRQ